MAALYDNFDYPSYWEGREYEHRSEIIAIKYLLSKIHKVNDFIEVGAGYGRVVPSYFIRAKKILLTDPSAKLLKMAREKYKNTKKISFKQMSLENLPENLHKKFDLILMVRVLHHIKDLDLGFRSIEKLAKPGSYLIFEFPNKIHLKAIITRFLKGDFTFPLDLTTKDLRSKKNIKKNSIPFNNFHPFKIESQLENNGFEIIEKISVSNVRSSFMKKYFPIDFIISIEKFMQQKLSWLNFGPSIFVLARKVG